MPERLTLNENTVADLALLQTRTEELTVALSKYHQYTRQFRRSCPRTLPFIALRAGITLAAEETNHLVESLGAVLNEMDDIAGSITEIEDSHTQEEE